MIPIKALVAIYTLIFLICFLLGLAGGLVAVYLYLH